MNHLKTFMLMAVLTIVFVLLGGLIAGDEGLIFAFILALAMLLFHTGFTPSATRSWLFNSTKWVLCRTSSRATFSSTSRETGSST